MGLTGTAARAIWLVAVVTMVGTGLSSGFEAAEAVKTAQEARALIEAEQLTMRAFSPKFCYEAGYTRINVTATHAGREPIAINASTIVVDGVAKPTFTTTVDGRGATAIWTPGETAHWYVTTPDPQRVVIYTPRGVAFNATEVACTSYAHVAAMATYTGTTPDAVFAKGEVVTTRVTVDEQNDLDLASATVYIEIRDPSSTLRCNCTGVTNSTGVATIPYTLPNANLAGTWTIRTTLITGTNVYYQPSANLVTQITFTESN